jgi:hypothetical protein
MEEQIRNISKYVEYDSNDEQEEYPSNKLDTALKVMSGEINVQIQPVSAETTPVRGPRGGYPRPYPRPFPGPFPFRRFYPPVFVPPPAYLIPPLVYVTEPVTRRQVELLPKVMDEDEYLSFLRKINPDQLEVKTETDADGNKYIIVHITMDGKKYVAKYIYDMKTKKYNFVG